MRDPGRSNVAPILEVHLDRTVLPVAPEEVQQQLSEGDPRIELFTHDNGVEVMPYMMEQGEDVVVARRLREVLKGACEGDM